MALIVEADGASRGNPGEAAYGALVRDAATGAVLAETGQTIGLATNNVAEYQGLIAGLRLARSLNPQAWVDVRMDSRLVVEQMSGNWKIKHPGLRPLAVEAAGIFPSGQVTYRWVARDQNAAADRLANVALDKATSGPVRGVDGAGSTSTVPAVAAVPSVARATVPGQPTSAPGPGPRTSMPGPDPPTSAPPSVSPTSAPELRPPTSAPGRPSAEEWAVSATGGGSAVAGSASRPSMRGWARPDLEPPTTIVLLRHGETAMTPHKRFCGTRDVALSERGRRQARQAAAVMADRWTIEAIVSSPLARSRTTAEIVGAAIGLPVEFDDDLRECDFGEWDGLTFAEVEQRYPDELAGWLDSIDVAPPNGESLAQVAARVRRAHSRLVRRYPARTVLIVSHVTPIKHLVCLALGVDPAAVFRMELVPGSVSVALWFADGNASLRLFNDTSHLRPGPVGP